MLFARVKPGDKSCTRSSVSIAVLGAIVMDCVYMNIVFTNSRVSFYIILLCNMYDTTHCCCFLFQQNVSIIRYPKCSVYCMNLVLSFCHDDKSIDRIIRLFHFASMCMQISYIYIYICTIWLYTYQILVFRILIESKVSVICGRHNLSDMVQMNRVTPHRVTCTTTISNITYTLITGYTFYREMNAFNWNELCDVQPDSLLRVIALNIHLFVCSFVCFICFVSLFVCLFVCFVCGFCFVSWSRMNIVVLKLNSVSFETDNYCWVYTSTIVKQNNNMCAFDVLPLNIFFEMETMQKLSWTLKYSARKKATSSLREIGHIVYDETLRFYIVKIVMISNVTCNVHYYDYWKYLYKITWKRKMCWMDISPRLVPEVKWATRQRWFR